VICNVRFHVVKYLLLVDWCVMFCVGLNAAVWLRRRDGLLSFFGKIWILFLKNWITIICAEFMHASFLLIKNMLYFVKLFRSFPF
jgi:hypothetical protein